MARSPCPRPLQSGAARGTRSAVVAAGGLEREWYEAWLRELLRARDVYLDAEHYVCRKLPGMYLSARGGLQEKTPHELTLPFERGLRGADRSRRRRRGSGRGAPPPRLEAVDEVTAWQRLRQEMPRLLRWTRILVTRLPKTTAVFPELDYRRAGSGAAVTCAAPLPGGTGEGA